MVEAAVTDVLVAGAVAPDEAVDTLNHKLSGCGEKGRPSEVALKVTTEARVDVHSATGGILEDGISAVERECTDASIVQATHVGKAPILNGGQSVNTIISGSESAILLGHEGWKQEAGHSRDDNVRRSGCISRRQAGDGGSRRDGNSIRHA
ncbi:hypothetical protein BC830DRAFT_1155672 [Chytriomyces sp. MP71]|nr:hypothetical protein BC830DRAFT_1155672 [Chytriomyces sp. MP71]